MRTYSYETFPGQTIVRGHEDGYTADDLVEELVLNGDGQIVPDGVDLAGILVDTFGEACPAECVDGQYRITGSTASIGKHLHQWYGESVSVEIVELTGWMYSHFVTVDTGNGRFSLMVR